LGSGGPPRGSGAPGDEADHTDCPDGEARHLSHVGGAGVRQGTLVYRLSRGGRTMHAAPRSPVVNHRVQTSWTCLESGHVPVSPDDVAALLQDVQQRLPGVVACDCLSRVLFTRPTERSVSYA